MTILTGTSGFSYKEWKGLFYPEKLKNTDMLAYYAGRLLAVEINNTFYRLPRVSVLEKWTETVPEGFRFVLKASRQITHFKRLNEAEEVTDYMIQTARTLGTRLGAILFQLPPNFRLDLDRFERFVDFLPDDLRFAFEFRHPEWGDERVFDVLRGKNAALCVADSEAESPEVVSTADWGYLRLRKAGYSERELVTWADRIGAQEWASAFVFFKHEDDASGPLMAEAFLRRFNREQ